MHISYIKMFLVFPFEGRVPLLPRGSWLLFYHVQSQMLPAGDTPDPHACCAGPGAMARAGGGGRPGRGWGCPQRAPLAHCTALRPEAQGWFQEWGGTAAFWSTALLLAKASSWSVTLLPWSDFGDERFYQHPPWVSYVVSACVAWLGGIWFSSCVWVTTYSCWQGFGWAGGGHHSGCLQPAPAQRTKEEKSNTREWHRFTASRDVASRSKTEGAGSVAEQGNTTHPLHSPLLHAAGRHRDPEMTRRQTPRMKTGG